MLTFQDEPSAGIGVVDVQKLRVFPILNMLVRPSARIVWGSEAARGQRPPLFSASSRVPGREPRRRPFALPFEALMSTDGPACRALQLRSPSPPGLCNLRGVAAAGPVAIVRTRGRCPP